MNQLGIVIVVIVMFLFTELDKIIYKKLDDKYKKIILKDKYNESEEYYNSNSIIQFIKNIENQKKAVLCIKL